MSYDISIQPKDSKATAQRSVVDSFIASLPGVRQESSGEFAYGDKRQRLFVHIITGDADTIDSVSLSVPAAFTGSSCEQALLLSFQIAEHLGWQVFDPQVGDYLDKSTATEILRSQKNYGDTTEEVLRRRSAGEASFAEIFGQQFACHSAWVLIPTLLVAALVAGYFVVEHGVAESRFPWIFFGTALGIHVVRALVCTIWQRIRDEKKRAA
jgi:hypothetical protein